MNAPEEFAGKKLAANTSTVPARKFGLQRFKGGVKSLFFLEREFRLPLLSYDL